MNLLVLTFVANTIFVDASATGANDGTSWRNAFTDLQPALAAAVVGDEVWVARGTYKPTATLDRSPTFKLAGLLYGGFDGTESTRDRRAGLFDETILSGDLAGDDGPDFANRSDNSRVVVTVETFVLQPMTLDGFTIRGAHGDLTAHRSGGGLSMDFFTGDVAVRNCTFEENFAVRGGAIGNPGKSGVFVERCRFVGNRARDAGGAIDGGGFTEIRSSTFLGNAAGRNGGGLYYSWLVVDCVFSGNTAGLAGGGAFATSILANCTFSGNAAPAGAAIGGGYPWFRTRVQNSIVWENHGASGPDQAQQIRGSFIVDDSVVQHWNGLYAGTGTFAADPRFKDPLGPDGIAGTIDDDLQLESDSPCVDTGFAANYLGNGVDAAGAPRFVDALACDTGGVLDRGALERSTVDGTSVYCTSTPSSLGVPAEIGGPCVVVLSTDGVARITAAPVPARSAVLLLGTPGSPQPFGDGNLCLAGSQRRSAAVEPRNGTVVFDLYMWTQEPGAAVGLQVLFRDPRPGGSGFNLSSAMRLLVLP